MNETSEIVCKIELIYLPCFFDSMMEHLDVLILPDEAVHRGPVQYRWMYPTERRLGTSKVDVKILRGQFVK